MILVCFCKTKKSQNRLGGASRVTAVDRKSCFHMTERDTGNHLQEKRGEPNSWKEKEAKHSPPENINERGQKRALDTDDIPPHKKQRRLLQKVISVRIPFTTKKMNE